MSEEHIGQLSKDVQELYWIVPKLWPHSTVAIIGGGCSVNEEDLIKIQQSSVHTIGCNAAFLDFPWVEVCYFGD